MENGVPSNDWCLSRPGISPGQTIGPRFVGGEHRFFVSGSVRGAALKTNPLDNRVLHVGVAVLAFLAYYFVFELLFSRTPGKLLMGLVVRKFDGSKCGWGGSNPNRLPHPGGQSALLRRYPGLRDDSNFQAPSAARRQGGGHRSCACQPGIVMTWFAIWLEPHASCAIR